MGTRSLHPMASGEPSESHLLLKPLAASQLQPRLCELAWQRGGPEMGLPHPSNRAPRKKQRAGLKGIRQLATHRNSLQSRKHSVSALCLTRAALGLTVALPFVNAEQPDFALFCADTLSRATFAKAGCPAALPRSKGVVFTREAIRLSIPRLCNSQRVCGGHQRKNALTAPGCDRGSPFGRPWHPSDV